MNQILVLCKDLDNNTSRENLEFYNHSDWVQSITVIYSVGKPWTDYDSKFEFIQENNVAPWLSIDVVRKFLPLGFKYRASWYYQQLLKLTFLFSVSSDTLLIDADCRIVTNDLLDLKSIGVISHSDRLWNKTTAWLIGDTTDHLSYSFVTENILVPPNLVQFLFEYIVPECKDSVALPEYATLEILKVVGGVIKNERRKNLVTFQRRGKYYYDALSEYELLGRFMLMSGLFKTPRTRNMIRLSLSGNWYFHSQGNENLRQVGIEE
jgi:hypothetical protein